MAKALGSWLWDLSVAFMLMAGQLLCSTFRRNQSTSLRAELSRLMCIDPTWVTRDSTCLENRHR